MELPLPDDLHPRAGVRVRRRRRLQLIAAQQGGCFTVSQAARAGYERRARHHHLSYGNWRRTAAPGVYRLSGWPSTERERLHAWLLWAGSGAALTSWTVLDLHGHRPPPIPGTGLVAVSDSPPAPDPPAPDQPDRPDQAPLAPTPVDIVRPRHSGRRTAATPADAPVAFHFSWASHQFAELLDDLVVRPLDEALCLALRTSTGRRAAWVAELTESLLDDGRLELSGMLETARHTPAPPMSDLLWPRLRRGLRSVS